MQPFRSHAADQMSKKVIFLFCSKGEYRPFLPSTEVFFPLAMRQKNKINREKQIFYLGKRWIDQVTTYRLRNLVICHFIGPQQESGHFA